MESLARYFGGKEPDYFRYYVSKKTQMRGVESLQTRVTQCMGHGQSITAVDTAGRLFVTGDKAKGLIAWNFEGRKKSLRLTGHMNAVTGVLLYPEYNKVVSCSSDRSLRIWDISSLTGAPAPIPKLNRQSSSTSSTGGGGDNHPSAPEQLFKKSAHKHGVTGIRRVD